MKIIERIKEKQRDIYSCRQPVIAFLGDSVTQGCFDVYGVNDHLKTVTQSENGYHEKVRKIFSMLYPDVPLSVINAGISGDTAERGCKRFKRDVLSFVPDLIVVCYGLNDASQAEEGYEKYISSLQSIFDEAKENETEVIFMTPNLRTTNNNVKRYYESFNICAQNVAQNENDGWLEKYLSGALKLCEEKNVSVCDCNKIWKTLKENDVDINNLLSNRINHPTEKMLWVFAYELVKLMFK